MNQVKLMAACLFLLTVRMAQAQFTPFPTEIPFRITDQHVRVPFSKLYVVLPSGFNFFRDQPSVYHEKPAGELKFEFRDSPFLPNTYEISPKFLESHGDQVLETGAGAVNGGEYLYKWTLARFNPKGVDGYADCPVLYFVLGNEHFSISAKAISFDKNRKLERRMRECLASIAYDSTAGPEPLEREDFSLSWEGTAFKPARSAEISFALTKDGQLPAQTEDQATMYTFRDYLNDINRQPPESYFKRRFAMLAGSKGAKVYLKSYKKTKLGGRKAYELTGTYTIKGKPGLFHRYVLIYWIQGPEYAFIVGTTTLNVEENMAAFRKIARSYRLK